MNEFSKERRLTPVNNASAWTAPELANDDAWITHLTPAHINEIDAALSRALGRGFASTPFGQEDFPLPTFAPVLADVMDNVENGRGVNLIKGLPIDRYTSTELRVVYWGLATYFGESISQNSRGEMIAEVTDRGNDHDNMNVRGYKTSAPLAPHVDSCDMTTLLCVENSSDGGDSLVSSSSSVYNAILAEYPDFLDAVYTGFRHDLRGEGVTGRIDELTTHAFPIFSYCNGTLSCAFNSRIMRSARAKAGPPLTEKEDAAIDLVIELAQRPDLQHRMRLQPGDIQIINNYSILHARDGYEDPPESRRELLRMWFRFHRPRTMVPGYGDRYNTGDRGGVAIGEGAQYSF